MIDKNLYIYTYTLLIVLSIPFWLLSFLFKAELLPGLPLSAISFLVPFIAGLIYLLVKNRRKNIIEILTGLVDVRRIDSVKAIFLIAIGMPLLFLAVFIISYLGNEISGIEDANIIKVIPLLLIFICSAIGEEFLWTGLYLRDFRINRYYKMAVLIALAYVVWHFIPFIQTGKAIEWIIGQALFSFAFRILIVQLYILTNRALVTSIIVHSTYNLSWQMYPNSGSFYDPWKTLLFTIAVVIVLEIVIRKKRLTIASTE